jgi:hypothetical protein
MNSFDLENRGYFDGLQDGQVHSMGQSFGYSVELSKLTPDEKCHYESGYYNGFAEGSGGR